jgi:hypothetical protein
MLIVPLLKLAHLSLELISFNSLVALLTTHPLNYGKLL